MKKYLLLFVCIIFTTNCFATTDPYKRKDNDPSYDGPLMGIEFETGYYKIPCKDVEKIGFTFLYQG